MTETEEYERALLGAVLDGFRDVPALTRIVSEADFYQPRNGQVWRAIVAVHEKGDLPNPLTVFHHMGTAAHQLPQGAIYLTGLHAPGPPEQAPFYAAKVRDASVRRQIADLGNRCHQIVTDYDKSPQELLESITQWAEGIETYGGREPVKVGSVLEKVIDIAQHGEADALPTPWSELNDLVGGWYPGQFITVAARPGVGKSIALENIATDAARRHRRQVLFVSLEMSATEITQRTMAHTAGVELRKLRTGTANDHEWDKINRAAKEIAATPLEFADSPNQTISMIRASALAANQEAKRSSSKLGLIVVDYLTLITPRDQKISRQQQVGEMTRGLKLLGRELQVPVICAAQLNRQSVSRAQSLPILSDLREAGDIEQDSDVVIFLHEDFIEVNGHLEPSDEVKVIVAKQRAGPLGTRTLRKFGHYSRLAS
jgi:replicative DNA helicase